MQYPTFSIGDAKRVVEAARSGKPLDADRFTTKKGSGEPLELGFVTKLKTSMNQNKARFAAKLAQKGDREGAAFEAISSSLVHSAVPNDPELVGDPGFWRWLAVSHFRELIEWRYGDRPDGCALANYGVGSPSENFLFRLWLRADIGHDPKSRNPYVLAKRGDVDFWRSHIFRQGYANARPFARALLKYQYPDPNSPARLKTARIRELVKRLRRLRSNMTFELLDDDESRAIIDQEATKLAE